MPAAFSLGSLGRMRQLRPRHNSVGLHVGRFGPPYRLHRYHQLADTTSWMDGRQICRGRRKSRERPRDRERAPVAAGRTRATRFLSPSTTQPGPNRSPPTKHEQISNFGVAIGLQFGAQSSQVSRTGHRHTHSAGIGASACPTSSGYFTLAWRQVWARYSTYLADVFEDALGLHRDDLERVVPG
jgi:hypothetical protein